MNPARSELIVGGQKSGKSRRAELLAQDWLTRSREHCALLIATALPADPEMGARIARHQADRAARVPGMATLEEPLRLGEAIGVHSRPDTLIVVDCLTLWLTNLLMPHEGSTGQGLNDGMAPTMQLLAAIGQARGPLVLVSNEIGLGVIPMGAEVRRFVDRLGSLNQAVAEACTHVTLMAAGLPLTLKGSA